MVRKLGNFRFITGWQKIKNSLPICFAQPQTKYKVAAIRYCKTELVTIQPRSTLTSFCSLHLRNDTQLSQFKAKSVAWYVLVCTLNANKNLPTDSNSSKDTFQRQSVSNRLWSAGEKSILMPIIQAGGNNSSYQTHSNNYKIQACVVTHGTALMCVPGMSHFNQHTGSTTRPQ